MDGPNTSPPIPPATCPSADHSFPQVCRKIGEKLRQSQAEQANHCLIAIYARAPATSAGVATDDGDGEGQGLEGDGYSSGDDLRGGNVGGRRDGRVMGMSASLHGGRMLTAEDGRLRQRCGGCCVSVDVVGECILCVCRFNHLPWRLRIRGKKLVRPGSIAFRCKIAPSFYLAPLLAC